MFAVRRLVLVCTAILVAPAAFANYTCRTTNAIMVNPQGVVTVDCTDSGLRNLYICTIGGTANGVNSDTCKAMTAALLEARTTGGTVTWGFSDTLTCATHPAWAYLTGWYYGPYLNSAFPLRSLTFSGVDVVQILTNPLA